MSTSSLSGPTVRGGASLVRPGIVGEPCGINKILAATVVGVNVAPLGTCVIHTLTVSLNMAVGIDKGEA